MNDPTERARSRVAELRKELDILEQYLRLADEVRAILDTPVNEVQRPVPAANSVESEAVDESAPLKRTRVTDNPKPEIVVSEAILALADHGRPMTRRELHKALAARGVVVKGVDPVKALGTILWRGRDRIIQLEGYGYWPVDLPYPRANYYPAGRGEMPDLL